MSAAVDGGWQVIGASALLIVLIERAKDNNVKGESRSYTTFVSICAAMVTTMINQMIYFVSGQFLICQLHLCC